MNLVDMLNENELPELCRVLTRANKEEERAVTQNLA